MGRNRDQETGRYKQSYSDQDILDTLEEGRLGTSEVAKELNAHRTTAHSKLRDLEERELVFSTKVGNTLIWELAE